MEGPEKEIRNYKNKSEKLLPAFPAAHSKYSSEGPAMCPKKMQLTSFP